MSHSGEVPASPHLVCAGRAAFLCCQTCFDGCGQMRGIPSQLDHGSLGGGYTYNFFFEWEIVLISK